MLNQPTLEKLQSMKLHGMADAFRAQLETAQSSSLSFEERFAPIELLNFGQWESATGQNFLFGSKRLLD